MMSDMMPRDEWWRRIPVVSPSLNRHLSHEDVKPIKEDLWLLIRHLDLDYSDILRKSFSELSIQGTPEENTLRLDMEHSGYLPGASVRMKHVLVNKFPHTLIDDRYVSFSKDITRPNAIPFTVSETFRTFGIDMVRVEARAFFKDIDNTVLEVYQNSDDEAFIYITSWNFKAAKELIECYFPELGSIEFPPGVEDTKAWNEKVPPTIKIPCDVYKAIGIRKVIRKQILLAEQ